MFKLLFLFAICFVLFNCCVKQSSETNLSVIIDSLIQSSPIKGEAKLDQLRNKKNLIKKIYKEVNANQKILIIEQLRRDINSSYGIIFIYDTKKIITFDQTAEGLNVAIGLSYDKSGSLKARLDYLKDSTLERVERIKQRLKFIPDKIPSQLFFLDPKNENYKLIIY